MVTKRAKIRNHVLEVADERTKDEHMTQLNFKQHASRGGCLANSMQKMRKYLPKQHIEESSTLKYHVLRGRTRKRAAAKQRSDHLCMGNLLSAQTLIGFSRNYIRSTWSKASRSATFLTQCANLNTCANQLHASIPCLHNGQYLA